MKVAMYVRVSTQRQALTQTIEQQLQILHEYSQDHEWLWQEEFLFRDDGYSGATLHRPGLDHLRDQIRRAAFDRYCQLNAMMSLIFLESGKERRFFGLFP